MKREPLHMITREFSGFCRMQTHLIGGECHVYAGETWCPEHCPKCNPPRPTPADQVPLRGVQQDLFAEEKEEAA